MRRLTIHRKKHFVGSLITYNCVLNKNLETFGAYIDSLSDNELDELEKSLITIKNGQTITIEIDEIKNYLFILAITSTGPAVSNEITIEPGTEDIAINLITKYTIFKGSSYKLEKV